MDGFLSQMLAVSFVLLVLGASVLMLKRRGHANFRPFFGRRADSEIAVLSKRILTSQHSLFLVRVRGRSMLIGTSPGQCQLVEHLGSSEGAEV